MLSSPDELPPLSEPESASSAASSSSTSFIPTDVLIDPSSPSSPSSASRACWKSFLDPPFFPARPFTTPMRISRYRITNSPSSTSPDLSSSASTKAISRSLLVRSSAPSSTQSSFMRRLNCLRPSTLRPSPSVASLKRNLILFTSSGDNSLRAGGKTAALLTDWRLSSTWSSSLLPPPAPATGDAVNVSTTVAWEDSEARAPLQPPARAGPAPMTIMSRKPSIFSSRASSLA